VEVRDDVPVGACHTKIATAMIRKYSKGQGKIKWANNSMNRMNNATTNTLLISVIRRVRI